MVKGKKLHALFCALLVRVRYALTTVTDSSPACRLVQQARLSEAGVAIWAGGRPARACSGCTLLIVRRTVQGTDVQHAFMADTPFRTPRSARGAPPPPLSARSYGTLPSARSSYGSTSHGRTPRQKIPIAIPVVTTNNTRAPNPRRLYPMPKSSRPTDVYEEWAQGGANPEIPVRACKSHVCL